MVFARIHLVVPFLLLAFLWLAAAIVPVRAQDGQTLVGVPLVENDGVLSINGQKIALWGVDFLAPDQQCWQGDMAWACGEQAITALKHYLENKTVECVVKQSAVDDAPLLALCSRFKGPKRQDIAEHMILKGWAMERASTSGGYYFEAEAFAQKGRYGIWSSRFQTAQDWRGGVQRFVGEDEDETAPPLAPADDGAEAD